MHFNKRRLFLIELYLVHGYIITSIKELGIAEQAFMLVMIPGIAIIFYFGNNKISNYAKTKLVKNETKLLQ